TEGATIAFSEAFIAEPSFTLVVGDVVEDEGVWALAVDEESEHQVMFDRPELASLAAQGLSLVNGAEASRTYILNAPVPVDATMADGLVKMRIEFEPEAVRSETHLPREARNITAENWLRFHWRHSTSPCGSIERCPTRGSSRRAGVDRPSRKA